MITIKSEHEIELMRTAGLVLAKVHDELEQYV
jgi:methionine aminopeptidase